MNIDPLTPVHVCEWCMHLQCRYMHRSMCICVVYSLVVQIYSQEHVHICVVYVLGVQIYAQEHVHTCVVYVLGVQIYAHEPVHLCRSLRLASLSPSTFLRHGFLLNSWYIDSRQSILFGLCWRKIHCICQHSITIKVRYMLFCEGVRSKPFCNRNIFSSQGSRSPMSEG